MCGRYTIFTEEDNKEIWEIINEVNNKCKDSGMKTGEIYPTDKAPVLTAQNEELSAQSMSWGFPNFKNKGVIINARAETAMEKPLFRSALLSRRCAVPSTGFYEWSHDTAKQKYLFRLPGLDMLYMAGFYGIFDGMPRFVILTTAANPSVVDIHSRMPVVLEKENVASWVLGQNKAASLLLAAPPLLTKVSV